MTDGRSGTRPRALSFPAAALAAGLVLLLQPPVVAAQDASITGRITSTGSGEPIEGAEVLLTGTEYRAVSSEGGLFRMDDIRSGRYSLSIHYLGAESKGFDVRLAPREDLDVAFELKMRVIPVPGLEVTVNDRHPVGKLYGFYRRSETSPGYFITREDIAHRNSSRTTDILRQVPGLEIGPSGIGRTAVTMSRRDGCVPDYYVDGARAPYFDMDNLQPIDIAGIEVYRGNSEVPVEFKHADRCGVIVVWTRDPSNWRSFQ